MRQVEVDGVVIEYTDSGSGAPVVFVHGVYVTGALWSDVVTHLSGSYRCIAPTWPLGAQSAPVGDADLSVPASGARIAGFIEALDLTDVTLVANDTGGGVVLAALGNPAVNLDRVSRLVFTNCDSFEHFPPKSFKPLVRLCRLSTALGAAALRPLASGMGQRFFASTVTTNGIPPSRHAEIFGGFAASAAVRRDAACFSAGLDPRYTLAAAPALAAWSKPVLVVWGDHDSLFPLSHGERLAAAFPAGQLRVIENSATYVMIDQPAETARSVDDFIRGR